MVNNRIASLIVILMSLFTLAGLTFAQETESDTTANKALVQDFIEVVFNQADIAAASEYAAQDYVQNLPGVPSGLEALGFGITMLHNAFPDINYTIEQIGAEGDLVAARILITGTQESDFNGIPATGRRVAAYALNFWRVEDGLLAEHWEVTDQYSFLTQLGVIPGGQEAPDFEATEVPTVEMMPETVSQETLDANRAVVESLLAEVISAQNLDLAAELLSPDFVWYNPFVAPGIEGFTDFYTAIFEAFPDVNREIVLTVADGDLVFALNIVTGTHEGGEQLYGVPPTGNPINYASSEVYRLVDGLIVELWDVADYVTLFNQIGLLQLNQ